MPRLTLTPFNADYTGVLQVQVRHRLEPSEQILESSAAVLSAEAHDLPTIQAGRSFDQSRRLWSSMLAESINAGTELSSAQGCEEGLCTCPPLIRY